MKKRTKLEVSKTSSKHSALASSMKGEMERSILYRKVLAEREEILRHKWFLSERAGHDVGIYEAMADWVANHRADWQRAWEAEQKRIDDREENLGETSE